MSGKRILFYGDSITDGNRYRDKEREWDLNHQMGHGYAFAINAKLGSDYPERDYGFINKGISGNRIVDLYSRLEDDVVCKAPDILSFLIGVNDCMWGLDEKSATSPVKFEKVFRLLLDEVLESMPQCKLVLCEPFLLPGCDGVEKFKARVAIINKYQEITEKLSEAYGAVFIPLQKKYLELSKIRPAEYWIWDGVHPTVCGHQIIADAWIKAVSEASLL